jgi:hypothetical protein
LKIFVSYPSDQRELAEHLRLALEGEGHEVFTDRSELKEGEPYHEALREAIEDADAMVFVVTPRSVAPGSYALTELDLAQRRWRIPGGRVLPVLAEPTPVAEIPPYLRSVTLLQPRGDLVAETVAAVDRMQQRWPIAAWVALLAGVLVLAAAGAWLWQRHQQQLAQEQAAREREAAELTAAVQLCTSGSHAVGWEQFTLIMTARPDDEAARREREDCGMRWLREMRVVSDKETFSAQVGKIQPVLAQGLARSTGPRRADLRAHLGWAEFLRSRDGVASGDPAGQYQAALAEDPGNVYAHTMWAHYRVWTSGRMDDETRRHYAEAAQATRERPWVRGMQFASAYQHRGLYEYAVQVASDMRLNAETPTASQRNTLRSYVFDSMVLSARDRAELLARVPGPQLRATYEWLFPAEGVASERSRLDRFSRAWLVAGSGDRARARRELEALQRELRGEQAEGRLVRAVDEVLAELGPG